MGVFLIIFMWVFFLASWIVHVVTCIKAAAWILLVVGAVAFPIGIVHGIGVMFGVL